MSRHSIPFMKKCSLKDYFWGISVLLDVLQWKEAVKRGERKCKATKQQKYPGEFQTCHGTDTRIAQKLLFQILFHTFYLFLWTWSKVNQTQFSPEPFSGLTRCGWVWKCFLTEKKSEQFSSTSKARQHEIWVFSLWHLINLKSPKFPLNHQVALDH